ncbi:MAG TPA: DUF2142 domain-containing protein [Planctomycetota bacterium]|nr:DUF2142 domain-containing protein [Planctomycetota bacterium]
MIQKLETLDLRWKTALIAGVLLAAGIFLEVAGRMQGSSGGTGLRVLAVAGVLGVLALTLQALFPLLRLSRVAIQRVLLSMQLASALVIVFFLPPFQGPDEIAHWQSAVQLYRRDPAAEPILVWLPQITNAEDLPFHPERRFDPAVLRETPQNLPEGLPKKVGYASPLSYPAVAVVSVFFPRVQSLPEALTFYYLSRLLPILALTGFLIWLVARLDVPFCVLFFLSLPLVQQQCIVVSSDTLVNFSTIAAVVLTVLLWKNFSWPLWVMLTALCLVATYAKVNVGALLLFPLLFLPWRRLPMKPLSIPALLFGVGVILYAAARLVESKLSASGGTVNDPATTQAQIAYLKTPGGFKYFLTIYWNFITSIWSMGTFSSYLGWLDTPLSNHHFFLLRWSCIFAIVLDLQRYLPRLIPLLQSCWKELLIALGLAVSCFFIMSGVICAIMFVCETPPGWGGFAGVQARYLFPPLLVATLIPMLVFHRSDPTKLESEIWPPLQGFSKWTEWPALAFCLGALPFLLGARVIQLFIDITQRFW